MTRRSGVNSLVKSATSLVAQVPGGERLVLQAVKDLLDELRVLRRTKATLENKNAALEKENERLRTRVARKPAPRVQQRVGR